MLDNPYEAFLNEINGGEPLFSEYLRALGMDESLKESLEYADTHRLCIFNAEVWGPYCPGCVDDACNAE